MSMLLQPVHLTGKIVVHASKSQTHRALMVASLAKGQSVLKNWTPNRDTLATLKALELLGWATFYQDNQSLTIEGGLENLPNEINEKAIFCDESATTLRLLMPLVLVKQGKAQFTGGGKLLSRPMHPYIQLFKQHKIDYKGDSQSIEVAGHFGHNQLVIDGSVSSQFISGLLLALPLLGDNATLRCQQTVSSNYIALTQEIMSIGGIGFRGNEPFQWQTEGYYKPFNHTLEGDYSNGAWFLIAQALGHHLEIEALNPQSLQGDRVMIDLIRQIQTADSPLVDGDNCIDLIPLLAIFCALQAGKTSRLVNIGRLKDKESDRLEAIAYNLSQLGIQFEVTNDSLSLKGQKKIEGGVELKTFDDHRIAMALALAALHCTRPVSLDNPACVAKSYPDFWQDYRRLRL